MGERLFSFIETSWFSKRVTDLLRDDEYARMQWRLVQIPDIGDLIPGAGGLRKFRYSAKSKGKRGGARVIYYFAASHGRIYMLDIYTKDEQADVTLPRLRELKKLVDELMSNE